MKEAHGESEPSRCIFAWNLYVLVYVLVVIIILVDKERNGVREK